ncbi:MAG TPA: phosphoribosyltransferase family protein [Cytophagaceae bacterium]
MYQDRVDAALRLSSKLKKYKGSDAIILAIPRGGVETGFILAKELDLPLDVILIKKIGHPMNKEYAIGSVSLYGRIINEEVAVPMLYIEEETARIRSMLKERHEQYMEGRKLPELTGKTVILTDDGLATGTTMMAAVELVKANLPKKIVVAAPVAPQRTVDKLSMITDEVIIDMIPDNFRGVGQFYENFEQTSDEKAIQLLRKANKINT